MFKKLEKVSKENFNKAVKHARFLNKKRQGDVYAQNVVLPLGSFLFAAIFLVLLLGISYEIVAEQNAKLKFFETFSFIPEFCHKLWEVFGKITDNNFLKVVMTVVLMYLVPFVVCGVVSFVVRIFVRVKPPKIEGSDKAKAKQLYFYLDQAPSHKTDCSDAQTLWQRITGIAISSAMVAFVIYSLFSKLTPTQKDSEWWMFALLVVMTLIGGAFIYCLYARFHFVFALIIKPCYSNFKKWKEFKDKVDEYWLSVDPEESQRRRAVAPKAEYDGWKYKNLGKSEYYKSKFNQHYAELTGTDYETDAEKATRIASEVADELSGKGNGNY